MPGSQLAACIYTTNGAPVASPAPARAGTHAAHSLISARRAEVAEAGREEERRKGKALCWSGTPWQNQPERPRLYCWMIQRRRHKLIRFGKFAAALRGKKVAYERKSQSRARGIIEMLKFNAKALENRTMSCFFSHCKLKGFFFGV